MQLLEYSPSSAEHFHSESDLLMAISDKDFRELAISVGEMKGSLTTWGRVATWVSSAARCFGRWRAELVLASEH